MESLEHRSAGIVGEAHASELQVHSGGGARRWRGAAGGVVRRVEPFEHPLGTGLGRGEGAAEVRQLVQGLIELRQISQKHQQLAECQVSGGDLPGSEGHDSGGAGSQDCSDRGQIHDLGTMLVPSGTEGFTGLLVEGGRQGRFAGERLNQGQVGHPLLDGSGDPGIGRLGLCSRPLEARTEHPHDEEQWGHGGQRHGRQWQVDACHHHRHGDHTSARGQAGENAVSEESLKGVGVPGGPVNPVTGRGSLDFAWRQSQQALEDLMADALKSSQPEANHQVLLGGPEETVQQVGPQECQRPASDGVGFSGAARQGIQDPRQGPRLNHRGGGRQSDQAESSGAAGCVGSVDSQRGD